MGFKNAQQRKFLFALDKDKKKQGLNPETSNIIKPAPVVNVPKLQPPAQNNGIPPIPGLKKLPRFGKMKNSLKNQFKGIK